MKESLRLEAEAPEPLESSNYRNLLTATLERALLDLRGRGNKGYESAKLAKEAYAWLMDDIVAPFSFSWVCLELGYDIKTVKKVAIDIYQANRPVNRFNINRKGHTVSTLTFSAIKQEKQQCPQTSEGIAADMNKGKRFIAT
jgi:hypothetical protein